jgi:hypothetical protein
VDVYLLAELHHSLAVVARLCGNKGDLGTAELSTYSQEVDYLLQEALFSLAGFSAVGRHERTAK